MLERIRFLTAGESHGKGLLGIIEGLPSNIKISETYVKQHLSRRQKGHGRGGRMKIEDDFAEFIGGVRYGETLGGPIGLQIKNKDWENWKDVMDHNIPEKPSKPITMLRPGHADLAGLQKFGMNDIRNILERSSARETTMRVALGSFCRKMLEDIGIEIGSRVVQIHNIKDIQDIETNQTPNQISNLADKSPVRCINKSKEKKMMAIIDEAKKQGDSVGGTFELIADGLPYGLGSHTQWYKKIQARLTGLLMSVNAFKAVEIGSGNEMSSKFGSEVHDEIEYMNNRFTRTTNNAGGIEGGMTNAQRVLAWVSMKPISTLVKPLNSVDYITKEPKKAFKERADSCAVPAASIISESMMCIVLADAILEKFGGDSMSQLKMHMNSTAKY